MWFQCASHFEVPFDPLYFPTNLNFTNFSSKKYFHFTTNSHLLPCVLLQHSNSFIKPITKNEKMENKQKKKNRTLQYLNLSIRFYHHHLQLWLYSILYASFIFSLHSSPSPHSLAPSSTKKNWAKIQHFIFLWQFRMQFFVGIFFFRIFFVFSLQLMAEVLRNRVYGRFIFCKLFMWHLHTAVTEAGFQCYNIVENVENSNCSAYRQLRH